MADLCTLAQVKTYLGITDTTADAVITQLIPGVSQQLLAALDRQDLTPNATYTDRVCGHGQWKLYLRHYPVTEITSVTVNDVALTAWDNTSTGTGYRFIGNDPNPENQQYIELISIAGFPAYSWYDYASAPYCFWPWSNVPNITIVYKAGYDTIPPAIVQAAIELVAFRRELSLVQVVDPNVTEVQMGDYREVTGGTVIQDFLKMQMPMTVASVIEQYRRIVL